MSNLIVLAEDEPELRALTREFLEKLGYEVIVAADGRECVKVLTRHTPKLILLDFNMPEIDGLKVLTLIKGDARLRDIPVIMMTAEGGQSFVTAAIDLGAVDYIVKPFDYDNVARRVASHIFGATKLTAILERLNTADANFFRDNPANAFFNVYRVKLGTRQLAMMLPKSVSIKEALTSEDYMVRFVNVYEKTQLGWHMIWPSSPDEANNVRQSLEQANANDRF